MEGRAGREVGAVGRELDGGQNWSWWVRETGQGKRGGNGRE